MVKHEFTNIRIPIEQDNPAITRKEAHCVKCGLCRQVCREDMAVGKLYDLEKTGGVAVCVYCGQCASVCPTGTITTVEAFHQVGQAVRDPGKIVVFSVTSAAEGAFGEAFGLDPGVNVGNRLAAALRTLGADYVLDAAFGADLTVMEQATELIARVRHQLFLPQFTSCCPAWIEFVETFYPDMIPHLSRVKSPISAQGVTVKTYFAQKMGLDAARIIHVAVTSCTAQKAEILRPELSSAGQYYGLDGMRDTDYVLTTGELAQWMRQEKKMFSSLSLDDYDACMGKGSGAGVLFGNTGGVMDATLRTVFYLLTGEQPPEELFQLEPFCGLEGVKEVELDINEVTLRLAVVHGLDNAKELLERIRKKEVAYDFVEVMACKGGCIGGGGQPKLQLPVNDDVRERRMAELYREDARRGCRCSHENRQVKDAYAAFYGRPGSGRAESMLHTGYVPQDHRLTVC